MDGQRGYNYVFGTCRISLTIIGLWPATNDSKQEELISLIISSMTIIGIILFITIPQTLKLIIIWGDLNAMTDNLLSNLPIAVVVLKMLEFRRHQKELKTILSLAMDAWSNKKTEMEVKNMQETAKLTRRISLVCMILGILSVEGIVVVTASEELNILPALNKRRPVLNSYFPFDSKPSPIYEITWLLQYTATVLSTVAYTGVTGLFIVLVLHLRCQVNNLRLYIENLDCYDSSNKCKMKISIIVKKHEIVNRFAGGIENIFNFMFLAEVLSYTVLLCLQFFVLVNLTTSNNEKLPILSISSLLVYVLHVGTHIFICCYTTDQLRDESLSICLSAYNYAWYNLPINDAKLLIIVMQRAGKPLQITAGKFFPISLRLYTQIIKTSVGYLSMLIALRDKV